MVDGPDALSKEAQRNATLLFFSHLRATFASKRVLREYKLTPEAFDWILGEVETRFNQARCPPLQSCLFTPVLCKCKVIPRECQHQHQHQ